MKVLLDENLPHKMRLELTGHEFVTTAYLGWSGVENGELLQRAAAAGFEVLVTNDRGLEYEQNLGNLPLAIIVISAKANTIEAIRPIYSKLLTALSIVQRGQFVKLQL